MKRPKHFISVRFNKHDAKSYSYKLVDGLEVNIGDRVVVQTGEDGVSIAFVSAVVDYVLPNATKWAFQKVDEELDQLLPRS